MALWSRARKAQLSRPYERLVLESFTVDEAAERLRARSATENDKKHSPIAILASMLILARLKKHVALLFVKTVSCGLRLEKADSDLSEAMEDDSREEEEKKVTIDAKSVGGRIGELGEMLEKGVEELSVQRSLWI
jgi:hypothetical protein